MQQTPIGLTASRSIKGSIAESLNRKGSKMTQAQIAEGWTIFKLAVSRTEKQGDQNKRVSVGTVTASIPTIKAFLPILTAAAIIPKDGVKPEDDDGVPLYDNDVANWLQSAITAKVSVKIRNSLVEGTTELQTGKSLPTNFEELLEAGERTGQAMKIKAECITALCSYIAAQGIQPASVERWKALFRQPEALAAQSDVLKGKALAYLEGFSKEQSAENLSRYMTTLTSIEDAAKDQAALEM